VSAWWSHNGEAVITTAVGIVASVIVSAIVFRRQRMFRRLNYSIITDQRLIPVGNYQEYSDLRIEFRDDPVSEPWIVIIRISNTGRQDIGPADMTKPISIDVGNNTCIRDARVTGSVPEEVYEAKPLGIDEYGRPFLEPVAINLGNSIQVQLLLDGKPEKVVVVGRGVGIDVVTELEAQRRDDEATAIGRVRRFQLLTCALTILVLLSTSLAAAGLISLHRQVVSELNPVSAFILVPRPGTIVQRTTSVIGTVQDLPQGNSLWVLVTIQGGPYYPESPCSVDNSQFSCPIEFGLSSSGKKSTIYVVDADARAVTTFSQHSKTSPSPLFNPLPAGATVLSAVTVTPIRSLS
jgi:hypothetical protein